MNKFEQLIDLLLQKGVDINLWLDSDSGVRCYDINVHAKSGLVLSPFKEHLCIAKMRYSSSEIDLSQDLNEIWRDLCRCVKGCMCGRDYISQTWEEILTVEGLLTMVVTTTTTYK